VGFLVRTIAGRLALASLLALLVSFIAFIVAARLLIAPELPEATLDELFQRVAGPVALAVALAALVALGVALLLARAIASPIAELTARTSDPAALHELPVDPDAPEEIRRLARALRGMAQSIRAEHRVAESERDRLAALVTELEDAIVIVDADDRVRLANPAAERLLGHRLVGRRLIEILREHEILDAIARARAGTTTVAHVERVHPRRFVRVVAKALEDGQLVVAMQDLSTLRRLETVRRDFIANLSHELRTPIASLKAMAEALEQGALEDAAAARDFVARIHREVDGLSELVGELLTLSRIESGADRVQAISISPVALIEEAIERMRPLAERARVIVTADVASDLPLVRADPEMIGRVLSNLVHNAVKFTPAGGAVRVWARARDGMVAVDVVDSGEGIAASDLDRVFERFFKSDPARAGAGAGLGLSIARHVVQAHGGSISATSDGPGRGSTFTFTLPVATEAPETTGR
jgi:two-component system phosphate regulon sensor histidine kinase PhoR